MKILRHTPDHAHILINTHILSPPYPPQCVGRDSKFTYNRHSIGICYEGGLNEEGRPADTRTQAQRFALLDLLTILKHQYPEAQIIGHYQLSASIHKACPCFDAQKEYFTI